MTSDQEHDVQVLKRLAVFRDETAQMCKASGHVFRTEDIEVSGGGSKAINAAKSLTEIDDMRFFLTSPVIIGVGAELDVVGEYLGMCGDDTELLTASMAKPITQLTTEPALREWNHRIDAIQADKMQELTEYIGSQVLHKGGKLIAVGYIDLDIPDPLAKTRGDYDGTRLRVRVFYPAGPNTMAVPTLDINGSICYRVMQTSADIKMALRKMKHAYTIQQHGGK